MWRLFFQTLVSFFSTTIFFFSQLIGYWQVHSFVKFKYFFFPPTQMHAQYYIYVYLLIYEINTEFTELARFDSFFPYRICLLLFSGTVAGQWGVKGPSLGTLIWEREEFGPVFHPPGGLLRTPLKSQHFVRWIRHCDMTFSAWSLFLVFQSNSVFEWFQIFFPIPIQRLLFFQTYDSENDRITVVEYWKFE